MIGSFQYMYLKKQFILDFQDYYKYAHINYIWYQNMNMINYILNNPVQSAG